MNRLTRRDFYSTGIFGDFTFDGDDAPFMVTLEHAYPIETGFAPVVPPGVYTCVRGTHALSNGVPFVTFEITGVSGHSGILFHAGNYNADSHGCVLCGKAILGGMITGSKDEFAAFMARLEGVDSFDLEVV